MSNNISIFGRLTQDPESRYSQDGKPIVNFTLADNRGDKASFFNCTAFGKTAENISKCSKGHRLLINGRMEQDEWTDKNGQNQRTWKTIVNDMTYVESAPSQQQQPQQQPQQYYPSQQNYGQPNQQNPQYNTPPSQQYAQPPGNQPPRPQQQYATPPTQPGYPPQPPQNYNYMQQDIPF